MEQEEFRHGPKIRLQGMEGKREEMRSENQDSLEITGRFHFWEGDVGCFGLVLSTMGSHFRVLKK